MNSKQWADKVLAQLGLTREVIKRYVVKVAPPLPHYMTRRRLEFIEKGLTLAGKPRCRPARYTKHPDLAGLPLRERKREIARRWRAAHKPGMSSGQRVAAR